MTTERDIHNQIIYARDKGLEEGLAKGLAKGREEGRQEGVAEGLRLVAEQMRKSGIAEEDVLRILDGARDRRQEESSAKSREEGVAQNP